MNKLYVYTDGSSLGNPGPGGWGVIFIGKKNIKELSGGNKNTTNNKMELEAVRQALLYLSEINIKNYKIVIRSDSKYVLQGIQQWISNWKKNNWKTANKQNVKNQEYWKEIDSLKFFLETDNVIEWEHVKAHNGEEFNEKVDDLARGEAESIANR